MKYFIYIVIVLVAVSVVTGFFIVGSPQQERLRRFDERRVSDLQNLQSQILYYWQSKATLPQNLAALNDSISGFTVPRDPESGQEYQYVATSPQSFQLCATFDVGSSMSNSAKTVPLPARMSAPSPAGYDGSANDNWAHGSGRVCFDRNIDKDLYPPKSTTK
jgi:hypothetical protein